MTEVRIRHEDDGDSAYLGDISLSDIESVIPLIKSWGVHIPGSGGYSENGDFFGQFVYDNPNSYYEVVFS